MSSPPQPSPSSPQFLKIDHIYYITISAEKEKRMEKQLSQLFPPNTIPYTKFEGINGKTVNMEECFKEKYITQNGLQQFLQRKKPFGSIGCYLSHIKLWFHIKNNHKDTENIMVLEDDIEFVPKNHNAFMKTWVTIAKPELILNNWDFIYYDHSNLSGKPVNKYYVVPFNGAPTFYNSLLSCYLIKTSSTQKLIDVCLPIGKMPNILEIDVLMRNSFHKFNAMFYVGHLAKQNKSLESCRCSINKFYRTTS